LVRTAPPAPTGAQKLKDRLDILEAERLVLTIELRNALIHLITRFAMRSVAIDRRPTRCPFPDF